MKRFISHLAHQHSLGIIRNRAITHGATASSKCRKVKNLGSLTALTWENRSLTVVRYPSRRTFLKLISHPTYAPLAPYKFIAVELDLVPVSRGTIVPDLR